MRLTILTCAALSIGIASGVLAADKPAPLDDAKCKALWTTVSPNGVTISQDKAVPYVVDFTMVDTDSDGAIDAQEFQAGCQSGFVKAP
jgi:sugar lactone lactonase YvrE